MNSKSDILAPNLLTEPQGITSISYFDSVEIKQRRYFTKEFLHFMIAHCGSIYGPRECKPNDGIGFQSLWLHQPSRLAIEYLGGNACKVARVHVALDIFPCSKHAAYELQEHLSRTFLPSFRPYDEVTWVIKKDDPLSDPSCYFGYNKRHGPRTTAAIYADRMSKVTNKPCCHLETRYELKRALRANSIESGHDLLHLDHKKFWEKRIILVQPPTPQVIGEQWLKGFLKRPPSVSKIFPYGGRTQAKFRIGHLLLRAAQDHFGYVNANDLLHFLRIRRPLGGQSIEKLFKPLDNSWLLPPSTNALWEMNNHQLNQGLTSHIAPSSLLSLAENDIPY